MVGSRAMQIQFSRRTAVTLALALFVLISLPASAQDATQLTVTVSDPTGARITDAAVVVSRGAQVRAVATDKEGVIVLPGLAMGAWTVEISRDGFIPVRRQVVIQPMPVTLTVALEISGLRQSVVVEA